MLFVVRCVTLVVRCRGLLLLIVVCFVLCVVWLCVVCLFVLWVFVVGC